VQVTVPSIHYQPAGPGDALFVHELYLATPGYFELLSIPLPSVQEVRTDLETAAADPRRITDLVQIDVGDADGVWLPGPLRTVGYVDVTLDYLEPGDATVNLLLIRADHQRRGIGRAVERDLERRLQGRVERLLASVYGKNPHARRFWRSLGFHFAIDAAPVVEWYAKRISSPANAGDLATDLDL